MEGGQEKLHVRPIFADNSLSVSLCSGLHPMLGGAELGPEALEQFVVFDLGGEKLLSRLQSWEPNSRAVWAFVISLDANSDIFKM